MHGHTNIKFKYHCPLLTQLLNCSFFHMYRIYFSKIREINTHVFNPKFWNVDFSKIFVRANWPRSLPFLRRIYDATQTEKPVLFRHLITWLKIVLSLRIIIIHRRIINNLSHVTLFTYSVFQIFHTNTETCQMHTCNRP